MRELRSALSDMLLERCWPSVAIIEIAPILSTFRARTGRNQPSSARFIFGPSVWLRFLISAASWLWSGLCRLVTTRVRYCSRPLQRDRAMQTRLFVGRPISRVRRASRRNPDGWHKRNARCPAGAFQAMRAGSAIRYGSRFRIARRIGQPLSGRARFAKGSPRGLSHILAMVGRCRGPRDARMVRCIRSSVGMCTLARNQNSRSLRNFPMQANGAEMLRLACIFATERGIEVCAPVHDAVLICAPLERLEDSDVARVREYMAEASRIVLDRKSCELMRVSSGSRTITGIPVGP